MAYIPVINCGFNSGDIVEAFEGNEPFDTKEECEEWIENNKEYFTQDEMAGGVFARRI